MRARLLLLCSLLLWQCARPTAPPRLELLSPDQTGIHFQNTITETESLNILTFEYLYNGAGVGMLDVNNDGLQDIFFTANQGPCELYLNKGKLHFENITPSSGIDYHGKWATGVAVVDINLDGWDDLYVCYAGPFADPQKRANELYINNHNNTFTESAVAYGLADTGHTTQAAFFDYDHDGDLDVYLLTNITDQTGPNVIRPKRIHSEMANTDRLYRNNGNHTFTDVSREAGITIEGYGLGVAICDVNRDGWPDVWVSNDYVSDDLLYINQQNGTFIDQAGTYFQHTSYSAMGNDAADINNDQLPDLIEVDMLPPDNKREKLMFGVTAYDRFRSEQKMGYHPQYPRNTLQWHRGLTPDGRPVFSEVGQMAGISATDWSWSPLLADMDNDGWKDLCIANGYRRDITNRDFIAYRAAELMPRRQSKNLIDEINRVDGAYLPNFVFQNTGGLHFQDVSSTWGFSQPSYSTGAAFADLDNDGDLDYVTNNTNQPAFVYENHSRDYPDTHYLQLLPSGPTSNPKGIGLQIVITTAQGEQLSELYTSRGYQSSVPSIIHFGLGKDSVVQHLVARWPDGKTQQLDNVRSNQRIKLKYADATSTPVTVAPAAPSLFSNPKIALPYKHQESHYADFKVQPLLPHKFSQSGPGLAVGDLNKDGVDDLVTGGAFHQSTEIWYQHPDGSFTPQVLGKAGKNEEDLGILVFDADQDGDQDIYVVSGGNEFEEGSVFYQDRLYINQGNGQFQYAPDALPKETASGSCVVAADYDQDGDLDLFVGGRVMPQHYPLAARSMLLQNNGGKFKDVTAKAAPGLATAGLVTAALWSDVDNDGQVDLMVVGEWMPLTVWKNNHGQFQNITASLGLSATTGWWNSITGADLDHDGDIDYVLGNLGLNARYHASPSQPLSLYCDDFNHDGHQEGVIAQYIGNEVYPAPPRDDLFEQMPQLKKLFPTYDEYARTNMSTFLQRTGSQHPKRFEAKTFASSLVINETNKPWQVKALPDVAQVSPVYGVVLQDFNHDGWEDLALTGNSFAPDVRAGLYDAGKGVILKNTGHMNFVSLAMRESGFLVEGDAKALVGLYNSRNELNLVSSRNNDSLRIHRQRMEQPAITLIPGDQYATFTFADGRTGKKEFYLGEGYLSQGSRQWRIPANLRELTIFDAKGKSRKVNLPPSH